MNPDDVASWLRSNPLFFEHYPALLADIQLPNPHGGKAIALGERQVQNLRERSRALEARLLELIAIGENNDAIGNKMHRLVLGLLSQARQPGRGALIAVLHQHQGGIRAQHQATSCKRMAPTPGRLLGRSRSPWRSGPVNGSSTKLRWLSRSGQRTRGSS